MRSILILAAVATLAACNPGGSQDAANDAPAGGAFPADGASYRLEAVATHENGSQIPIVMVRDGQKLRLEFTSDEGAATIITDNTTGESLVLSQAGGRTMAIRAESVPGFDDPTGDWRGELAQDATRTGACSGGGENGDEWTRTTDGVTKTACVTSDGIILGATEGGRVVWETTSVTRGPQPADQFALPPGVQVMDLGNMGGMMDAIEKARGD